MPSALSSSLFIKGRPDRTCHSSGAIFSVSERAYIARKLMKTYNAIQTFLSLD
jgi:hypothetical protein